MIAQVTFLDIIYLLVEDDWVEIDNTEANLFVGCFVLIPDRDLQPPTVSNSVAVNEPYELLVEIGHLMCVHQRF